MPKMIFKPYMTLTFAEVWKDYDAFKTDYDALITGFSATAPVTNATVQATYYFLVAQYGNNPIANSDVGQFKMKIVSRIFMYGPLYEKKQAIQTTLRGLTESELLTGAKQIYNHAFNPSSAPSTSALDELEYINDQNTANHKKSKMEAYSILWNLLHAEQSKEYIDRFKNCFAVFVDKMCVPYYISDSDEEEENNP